MVTYGSLSPSANYSTLAQFLPPETKSVRTDVGSRGSSEASPTVVCPVAPELLTELRRLMIEQWPTVRDSLAINECRLFAQKLETLGQRWECQPVLIFAQAVARHAENYAVVELERQLQEFGALVERLERSANP